MPMPRSLRILLPIFALVVAMAVLRLGWGGDPPIAAPPAMGLDQLRMLGDEQLISQLNLDWTWRHSPPEGADPPTAAIPEAALHLLAIVGSESGIRRHGLVCVAVASRRDPRNSDLARIAAAYEAIGASTLGILLRQAATIAEAEGALLDQWRDHMEQKAARPDRDPFAGLEGQVKAGLAAPGLRQRLASYLRNHLDQLAGG